MQLSIAALLTAAVAVVAVPVRTMDITLPHLDLADIVLLAWHPLHGYRPVPA